MLGVALALLAATLAWSLPDRLHFTGDTDLRLGIIAGNPDPEAAIPQAMVGDLWLHVGLPRALASRGPGGLDSVHRATGMLDAVTLGLLALALARVLGASGASALAVMAAAGWTGTLPAVPVAGSAPSHGKADQGTQYS